MRKVHHRRDISECDASAIQVGVDVLGNLLRRPAPPEVVADEVGHADHALIVLRRPGEADGAQLSEISVADGIGARTRSASEQSGSSHNGDSQSGQQRDESI